jgi:hypothetical protein
MTTKGNKIMYLALAVMAFFFLSTGYVTAQGETGFWQEVARVLGKELAEKMSVPDDVVISPSEGGVIAGTAGDTYTRQKIARISVTTTSSTVGSILNNSGRTRIITAFKGWLDNSDDVEGTTTREALAFHVTTSTEDSGTSTSNYIFDISFNTSSEPVYSTATDAIGDATDRRWADDVYLIISTGEALYTTSGDGSASGTVGVEYFYDDF